MVGLYNHYGRPDIWDENSDVYVITDDFVMKDEYKSIDKNN